MIASVKRLGCFFLFLIAFGIIVVCQLINIQFINKPDESILAPIKKVDTLECKRGGIIADDGRYLAFSIPEYRIVMDCAACKDTTFKRLVDSLARKLSSFYKDRSTTQYKELMMSAREKGKRYQLINNRRLSYQEMKEVSSFPILNLGRNRGGLIVEEISNRVYPYGKLAYRTLGRIKTSKDAPQKGLEESCDSILRGTKGVQPIRLTEHNEWIEDTDRKRVEPVDGMDVLTTLNVDIQAIAEQALLRRIKESDELEAGTAIVMKVSTGEIKALVNMRKDENGIFDETYNYALLQAGEPGSVFKLVTLTMLLKDGCLNLDTEITGHRFWKYKGVKKPFEDTHIAEGKPISIIHGFEISSNNVFRMLTAKYYGNDPQNFADRLNNEMLVSYNFDFDIKGMAKASIWGPEEKGKYWSDGDLPQMGMGYALKLTPLHTLCYYNAIANGGVMVKPHLVRGYSHYGDVIHEVPVDTIGTVCPRSVADTLKRALRRVVTNGTGRTPFKGALVEIGGKTGTAQVTLDSGGYKTSDGRKKHQATFAGFFPVDNPEYSIIVVVYSVLTTKDHYGATWAGPVVKEIADKIYISSSGWGETIDSTGTMPPVNEYSSKASKSISGGVPDVIGMGLRDAMRILEDDGCSVAFEGAGKVRREEIVGITNSGKKKIKLHLGNEIRETDKQD